MNVSLNWLSDHLDLSGRSTQQLADLLTFAGIEVEKLETRGFRSDFVVVAKVVSFVPHPNADRLRLCQVDDGSGKPRQIVCGAKNFGAGDKVPLALPGAVLPGNFTIKEGNLRGELSQGMMCSGRELGLGDDHDGLLILGKNAPVGKPLHEFLESDTLFELEVTPNRPDCLSHLGIARELSALAQIPLKGVTAHHDPAAPNKPAASEIRIVDANACPYYTARIISGIKVGPSPEWLAARLQSIGLRPINNVVDITNYVLFEMGQPLHAFDLARLQGGIIVRLASEGESFRALDGKDYALTSTDCVIADQTRPIAIAGVMGGEESGVTDATVDILLESAYFAPGMVRKTSRRLGLMSDSSYRFERGVDPQQVAGASALATRLILEICGGKAEPVLLTAGNPPVLTAEISLDLPRTNRLLGTNFSQTEVVDLLGRLGLRATGANAFTIPSYRADLQRPVDLAEELARIYGIQNISAAAGSITAEESDADVSYDFLRGLKQTLVGRGFYEAQTIKLVSASQLGRALGVNPGPLQPVPLKNPLSDDHTHLRPSVIPFLLDVAARNIRQGASNLRFFEAGTVFSAGKKDTPDERTALGLLISGPVQDPSWAEADPRAADMFDLRAAIEELCQGATVKLKPIRHEWLLLAAQILVNGKPLGLCGQLRPSEARKLDARHSIYLAELSVDLLQKTLVREVKFQEMPRFPAVTRDVALGVARSVSHSQFDDLFIGLKGREPLLEKVEVFDVFMDPTGQKIPADQKSVAYRLTYRNREKTLESSEVDAAHARMVEAVKKALPVTVR